jgi:hypothetical protein
MGEAGGGEGVVGHSRSGALVKRANYGAQSRTLRTSRFRVRSWDRPGMTEQVSPLMSRLQCCCRKFALAEQAEHRYTSKASKPAGMP